MLFKIKDDEFIPCEMSDIRKGDMFYASVEEKIGPLLVATEDAKLRQQKGEERWSIKVT